MAKVDPAGSAVVYGTYLSGADAWDGGITVDAAGAAYLTGRALENFPATPGAFDTTLNREANTLVPADAFVAKFNPAGSALTYATYLGGSLFESGADIAVDAAGAAYVAGGTTSSDFPTTRGALDITKAPDQFFPVSDAFVTKVDPSGSALVYSTYLGGSLGDEAASAIAVDAAGAAYVTGRGPTVPTTAGAYDNTANGIDAFVTKLTATGGALAYSTYLGGAESDSGADIALDTTGAVYITGSTSSTDFPTTSDAFDTTHNGTFTAFLAKLHLPSRPARASTLDFDGDANTDVSVFRPSGGFWFVEGGTVAQFGTTGDIPVPGDYDGDGRSSFAVFRPSIGVWLVDGGASVPFGTNGDIPVPADYDADGRPDTAVFRPSNGIWLRPNSLLVRWGTAGDIPVPGDYDGDTKADEAVFRPSSGAWFIRRSTGGESLVSYGTDGDIPVPGDYDGDGRAEVAVFRPSNGFWFVQGGAIVQWGTAGDIPVPGDYDGDGTTDIAVFRPSNGYWFVNGGAITQFGTSDDVPLPLPDAIRRFFFAPL